MAKNGEITKKLVTVAGELISVSCDHEDPEYVDRLANYINYIIKEFNSRRGYGISKAITLMYACLDLCDTLFRERDSKMPEAERSFEQMFHQEVFAHKRTADALLTLEKRLAEIEKRLEDTMVEYGKFVDDYEKELSGAAKGE
ncbi:MAG: cell division protein ZapA [Defluviitaleaceae bacterium]|nr:cell division protein ZapA [Defluviitaleaceae bacterium]